MSSLVLERNNGKLEAASGSYGTFTGNGFELDGVEDFISTQQKYTGSQLAAFTVGVWFRTTDVRGRKIIGFEDERLISSTSYDRMLYVGTDGKLYYGNWNGTPRVVTSVDSVADGTWQYATATYSNKIMKLYVNAVKVAELTLSTDPAAYDGYWKIGGFNLTGWPMSGVNGYLKATIGPTHVYLRELTSSEISFNYNAKKTNFILGYVPNLELIATNLAVTGKISSAAGSAKTHVVQRSTNMSGPWTTIYSGAGDAFTDSGLTASTVYHYRAKVIDGNKNTDWSVVKQITTLSSPTAPTPPPAPPAPTVLVGSVTSSTIRLSIQPPASVASAVASYTLYRTSDKNPAVVTVYQGTADSFTDLGLIPSTTYNYTASIILTNGATSSASTVPASATTLGGTAVVGQGTKFLSEEFIVQTPDGSFNLKLQSGDDVMIGDEIRTISSIESDTVLYVNSAFSIGNAGDKIYFKINNEYQGSQADKIVRGEQYSSALPVPRRWVKGVGEVLLNKIPRAAFTESPVYSTAKGPFVTEDIYQQTLENQQQHVFHLIKTFVGNESDGDPDKNSEVYWNEGSLPRIKTWLDQNGSSKNTRSAFPTDLQTAGFSALTGSTSTIPGTQDPIYPPPTPLEPYVDETVVMSATVIKAKAIFVGDPNSVLESNNVSSIVRTAMGVYTINFSAPFNSANYAVVGTCAAFGGLDPQAGAGVYVVNQTVDSVTISTTAAGEDNGNASFELGRKPFDPALVSIIVAGFQN